MKSIYNVSWTPHALKELAETIEYLEIRFSEKEISKLAQGIERFIEIISHNPEIFPKSDHKNIYKAALLKYNTVYYRCKNDEIEILSFFSNRQSPSKRKI